MNIRSLFPSSSSNSSANHTCPVHSLAENASENAVGGLTFYHFNIYLSAGCAALTLMVMFFFLSMHATHLSRPNEQLKIMRIALVIPAYSMLSVISIAVPVLNVYLKPWLDFVQSISLACFYLLVLQLVSPSLDQRDVFFAGLSIKRGLKKGQVDGLTWLRTGQLFILQYPVVAFLFAFFTDLTQAANVYCDFTQKPYFSKLWLTLAINISVSLAVLSAIRLTMALRPHLARHHPMMKLVAFKIIVSLQFLQSVLWSILQHTSVLNPTPKMTWTDLNHGIPALLTCLEMVPLSVFFVFAYPWRPYLLENAGRLGGDDHDSPSPPPKSYQGGPLGLRAWAGMLNPTEIFQAVAFSLRSAAGEARRQMGRRRAATATATATAASPFAAGAMASGSVARSPQPPPYQGASRSRGGDDDANAILLPSSQRGDDHGEYNRRYDMADGRYYGSEGMELDDVGLAGGRGQIR